jgi:hypothetical protein
MVDVTTQIKPNAFVLRNHAYNPVRRELQDKSCLYSLSVVLLLLVSCHNTHRKDTSCVCPRGIRHMLQVRYRRRCMHVPFLIMTLPPDR